jgi:hypothetical protein
VVGRFVFPAGVSPKGVKVRFEGRSLYVKDGGFSDAFASTYSVHVYEME